MSAGRPLKLMSLGPPHVSDPRPDSQRIISAHVRSFTALWIGMTTFMSGACGLCCLRAIAAKNWASDGYTHFASSKPASVVAPRGMEDVSREVERLAW
jgi:hypothetical protein